MFINHKHKFIFIHIPKTAGTSIRNSFDMNGYDKKVVRKSYPHSRCSEVKEYCGEKIWDEYFKFSFVRNPFDRFVSTYFYFKDYGRDNFGDMLTGYIVNRFSSFEDFTKNFINIPSKLFAYPHFNEQVCWTSNMDFDFIGRFENVEEDFKTICKKIEKPYRRMPHHKRSRNRKHYTEYYNDETRQIIENKYAKDLDHFGYKFGE